MMVLLRRGVLLFALTVCCLPLYAQGGGLAWSIKYDPKTFDPARVDDQASELVRYLTGGVLLRINRHTQEVEPSLAASWSVSMAGPCCFTCDPRSPSPMAQL
jgi:peptide/nickel transport system substrate-binding protein